MNHVDKKIIMMVTFIFLGVVIAIQVRSTFIKNSQGLTIQKKVESLNLQLEDEKKKVKKMQDSISQEEKRKDGYLKKFSGGNYDQDRKKLWETLNEVKFKAGLTDVKGKGITIFMKDAPSRQTDNPSYLVIHDGDVINIINDLKSAGAEAMSINGERLIATSEQVCAGPTIRINKNRYAIPYIINVIGDPNRLTNALENSIDVASMREAGITVEIASTDNILIPRYNYNIENQITGLEVIQ